MLKLVRPHLLLLALLASLAASAVWAQNESKQYSAKNGAFTFKAPAAFQAISDAPANALIALEVANFGVSFMAERGEPVEIETALFAEEMKKKLAGSGAKILGSSKANLGSKPAVSFLVGGIKAGKESLFVFNLRADHTYTFVLNYPEGQRKDAADLWKMIAPTIKFKA